MLIEWASENGTVEATFLCCAHYNRILSNEEPKQSPYVTLVSDDFPRALKTDIWRKKMLIFRAFFCDSGYLVNSPLTKRKYLNIF